MSAHSHDVLEKLGEETKAFYTFHGVQMVGIGFPPKADLITKLHEKLTKQIFDAGEAFEIVDNEEIESFQVLAKKDIKAFEDVFLIDHAFSFRYPELRMALESNANLRARLMNILKYCDRKKNHPTHPPKTSEHNFEIVEIENQEIEDPTTLQISEHAIGLSLWGNNISDREKLKATLDKLKNLKVLWMNGNPVCEDFDNFRKWIEENYPEIEILNSQFTANLKEWGLKFGHLYPNLKDFESFDIKEAKYLELSQRNVFNLKDFSVFSELKNLRSVSLKNHEMTEFLHTNKLFTFMKTIPRLENIDCDGALEEVLWELQKNQKLKDICPTLISINNYQFSQGRPSPHEHEVRYIYDNIWKLVGTYRLASAEQLDESNVWYIMDEFGSAIEHGDDPNCIVAPFLFAPNNKLDQNAISYSIMWPIKDIKEGENVTRDFLMGWNDENIRYAKSSVWFNVDKEPFITAYQKKQEKLNKITEAAKNTVFTKPENKIDETKNLPLKVITDYPVVKNTLNDKNFEFVNNVEDADIIWSIANLKDDFSNLNGRYFNQFPYEACIINKAHLADTVQDGVGNVPWIQPTYNLKTELNAFVGDYLERQAKSEDNFWILKPPTLSRSIDMVVTDKLDIILRLIETGPRLAQKYITNTLTIKKRKFDIRMYVLVRSMDPPVIFLYKGFYIRIANKLYTTDPRSLENFETHWTVMKYKGYNVDPIDEKQFITLFNAENKEKNVNWNDVYPKVVELVKEVFIAAARAHPEMKMNNARALYAIDLMLDTDYQPKLLEFTFSPDCERIAKDYPDFFNDVFNCLFLYNEKNVDRVL